MRLFLLLFTLLLSLGGHISYAQNLNDTSLLPKAQSGDVCAQAKIGYNYAASQGGLTKDYPKAIEWYEKAVNTECKDDQCKQCQMSAYRSLAIIYKTRLHPPNEKKAFYWFKKAAENNNALAFKQMAEYYAEGKYVKQDYEKAYYWITKGKGRNVKTSHDGFIAEIKSHLTPEQIKKIDGQNQKFLEKLAQKRRNKYAGLMDKINMGFNPDAPTAQKANARLAFEIGINKFHYDLEGIKKLIDQGAIDAGPVPSNSFLFKAQKNDDLELVKLLIEKGAEVNGVDERGFTVLHRAIGYGHTEIALALIQARANLKDSNDLANTPLMAAAGKGNLEIVKALIEAGADVNHIVKTERREESALTKAIFSKQFHIVDYLRKAGARLTEKQTRYLHDAFGDPFAQSGEKQCSSDTKLCPDKSRLKRTGASCEFAVCPDPKKYEATEAVKGTFSEIDTDRSSKAIFALNDGSRAEKDKVIAEIKANPGSYNPSALKTLSRVLFSRIEDEDGAFWYMAADLRKRHDILICEDKTSEKKRGGIYNIVHQFTPFAELNPNVLKSLLGKVLEWDRTTPYNYDVRWVNIGNGLRENKLTDPIPQGLCVPENKRDETREFSRKEYASVLSGYTRGFDYRAKPRRLNFLSRDEFKALLDKANAGDAEAQYKIATVSLTHEHKEFLTEDSQAFRTNWLATAAKQGHVAAMSKVGSYYLSGYGVSKEEWPSKIEEGKSLLIQAGKKGDLTAHESLGRYYLSQKDPIEAYGWYALGEYVLQKKNPKLQMFTAKKQKMKLEATLPEADLEKAKEKAKEYIGKYGQE